jgi:hypothetical protein
MVVMVVVVMVVVAFRVPLALSLRVIRCGDSRRRVDRVCVQRRTQFAQYMVRVVEDAKLD